jgi:hypothetical protein
MRSRDEIANTRLLRVRLAALLEEIVVLMGWRHKVHFSSSLLPSFSFCFCFCFCFCFFFFFFFFFFSMRPGWGYFSSRPGCPAEICLLQNFSFGPSLFARVCQTPLTQAPSPT